MLHGLVGFCFDVVCCRFKLGLYRPGEVLNQFSQSLCFHSLTEEVTLKNELNCAESVAGRTAAPDE